MDGLAGSLVLAILAYFVFFAWVLGDANAMKFLVVLLGAVIGFLIFNAPFPWRGPRTFMGDTGSQVLGIVVVWFSIEFTQGRTAGGPPPVTMLWVVGIVLLDFFTITVRRVIRRRNPASPDRAHLHHLLLRRGLTPAQTVLLLVAVNVAFGAVGTAGWLLGWPQHLMFGSFLAVGVLYFLVFLFPARFMRLGRRPRQPARAQAPGWTVGDEEPIGSLEPQPAAVLDPVLDLKARPAWPQGLHRVTRRRRSAPDHPRPPAP